MQKPTEMLYNIGKTFLRYLKGAKNLQITYRRKDEDCICGFSNAGWGGERYSPISISEYIFSSSNGLFLAEQTTKFGAQSSVKAKFGVCAYTIKEG